jgi:hypothetical protein
MILQRAAAPRLAAERSISKVAWCQTIPSSSSPTKAGRKKSRCSVGPNLDAMRSSSGLFTCYQDVQPICSPQRSFAISALGGSNGRSDEHAADRRTNRH